MDMYYVKVRHEPLQRGVHSDEDHETYHGYLHVQI